MSDDALTAAPFRCPIVVDRMLAPGQVIGGRYRLVRQLGEGGMGVVWAAAFGTLGREVAVKLMLREASAADPTAIDRFFAEARICGAIHHPGIVDVLDAGRHEDGTPFLVMELLEGDSLDKVLDRTGALKPLDVLPVVRDAARTLALAHDKGVIHRDIKPGNLFLHRMSGGQVVAKVLDFGISKMAVTYDGPAIKTRTGTVVGSPAYMSPEQAGGRVELDARSDVYGLGVILYEALGGRLPFTEENYNALIIDIAVHDPPSLATLAPALPKPVLELVKAAMRRDRDHRVPTAAALADRIEQDARGAGRVARAAAPGPGDPRRHGRAAGRPREALVQTAHRRFATSARPRAREGVALGRARRGRRRRLRRGSRRDRGSVPAKGRAVATIASGAVRRRGAAGPLRERGGGAGPATASASERRPRRRPRLPPRPLRRHHRARRGVSRRLGRRRCRVVKPPPAIKHEEGHRCRGL